MSNLNQSQISKTALVSKGNNDVALLEHPELSASVYQVEQHPLKMVELEISLVSTSAEGLEKYQAALYETLRRLIRRGMTAYVLSAELIESKGGCYEKGFREFSYQNVGGDTYSAGVSFLPTIEGYTYLVQNWGAIILRLRNLLGGEVETDKAEGLLAQKTEIVKVVEESLQSQGFVETKVEDGEMGVLLNLNQREIGSELVQTVDARELHEFLESKQQFANWIKNRIEQYGFTEGQDFVRFNKKIKANNAVLIEYAVSIDMAKELSMVERNEKGKQARQYFIACERQAKELTQAAKPQESKALSSKVAAELAIMQCYTEMLKPAPSSQLYMLQRIATNNKLDSSFLPDYTVDAPTDNSGGSSLPTAPVTTLLKENGIKESPATYNKMMQRAGILEKRQRRSTTSDSGTKDFWSITTEGLIYGKNITNPRNPRETQPHWYVDRFDELHGVVSRVGV